MSEQDCRHPMGIRVVVMHDFPGDFGLIGPRSAVMVKDGVLRLVEGEEFEKRCTDAYRQVCEQFGVDIPDDVQLRLRQ